MALALGGGIDIWLDMTVEELMVWRETVAMRQAG